MQYPSPRRYSAGAGTEATLTPLRVKSGRILLLAACALAANGQTIEVRSLYQPAPLAGVWRYQTGEGGTSWAEPGFDDSSWRQVSLPGAAHPIEAGYLWYRVRAATTLPAEPAACLWESIAPTRNLANGDRFVRGAAGSTWGQDVPAPSVSTPRRARRISWGLSGWHASRPWGFHLPDFRVPPDGDGRVDSPKIAEQNARGWPTRSPALLIIAATMLAGPSS